MLRGSVEHSEERHKCYSKVGMPFADHQETTLLINF